VSQLAVVVVLERCVGGLSKFNCNMVLSEVHVATITILMAVQWKCTAVTARHICCTG
jgi:hypothetical protein